MKPIFPMKAWSWISFAQFNFISIFIGWLINPYKFDSLTSWVLTAHALVNFSNTLNLRELLNVFSLNYIRLLKPSLVSIWDFRVEHRLPFDMELKLNHIIFCWLIMQGSLIAPVIIEQHRWYIEEKEPFKEIIY